MGAPRVTLDAFIERSNLIHNGRYDYSKVDWTNTKIPVEIICPVHGPFCQKPFKHLQGQGCPDCRKNATVTQSEFIERARKIHGANTYDYSRVQYVTMWTPVEIICPIHGVFSQAPAKHVKTGKYAAQGCPKCRYIRQWKTLRNRYGVNNPMQKSEFRDIQWEMTKRNGHASSSRAEQKMYIELCNVFGSDDVERNYKDLVRYPFRCDFYIKSLDLFIELNANWTHGLHWFDSTSESDVAKLNHWKERQVALQSSSYLSAITTWTVRDPLKRQTAQKNGLNYLVFWDNNLADFHDWLNNYIETNHTV